MRDGEHLELRKMLVLTARAMIDASLNLVEGARRICEIRAKMGSRYDDLLSTIIAFESDTDLYPIGTDRLLYNREYLSELDRQLNSYIEEAKGDVIDACIRLIEFLDIDHK